MPSPFFYTFLSCDAGITGTTSPPIPMASSLAIPRTAKTPEDRHCLYTMRKRLRLTLLLEGAFKEIHPAFLPAPQLYRLQETTYKTPLICLYHLPISLPGCADTTKTGTSAFLLLQLSHFLFQGTFERCFYNPCKIRKKKPPAHIPFSGSP